MFNVKVIRVLVLLFFITTFSIGAEEEKPKKIVFGIIPLANSTQVKDTFGNLTNYLEKSLGIKVQLYIAGDYDAIVNGLKFKRIDFAYLGPKSYIKAADIAKAKAIVIEESKSSGLGYYSFILSKKGSEIKNLRNMKDKKFAFVSKGSTSGSLIPMIMFLKKNISPKKYFSQIIYTGSHENSIEAVDNGKVDVAVTNNVDFSRGGWKIKDFNVIWKSSLIPGAPIAVREGLNKTLIRLLIKTLLMYKDKKGLDALKIKSFKRIDDSNYDSIRKIMKIKNKLDSKGKK